MGIECGYEHPSPSPFELVIERSDLFLGVERGPTMLPTVPTLDETLTLVRELHAGQVDKSGAPYVRHLERVKAHLVRLFPDATEAEQHAALLHDALEDTPCTAAQLRARGYDEETVAIVEGMTKPEGAEYHAYVEGIARGTNRGIVRVKLADNADNSDPARIAMLPPEKAAQLTEKYARARKALLASPLVVGEHAGQSRADG